jgi:hypothetical protein
LIHLPKAELFIINNDILLKKYGIFVVLSVLVMRRFILSGLILILAVTTLCAQSDGFITKAILVDGDTVPIYVMNEIRIFGPVVFKNKKDAIKFSKLVKNVKKVYPLAKITGIKVKEFDEIIKNAKTDKERKQKMKAAEDQLKDQFEDDVKDLTYTQGILLIKLIDRETGSSSYDLIKEFRGKIRAAFYQTLGKLFGYDLKTTYDPGGDDKEIESIVLMIESGAI